MKTNFFKRVLMMSLVVTALVSCDKDDDPVVYPVENFMSAYLANSQLGQATSNFVNSGSYEFGSEFIPLVKGKITGLRAKLPDVNATLRVTIWDKDAGTVIRTETMNVTAAGTEAFLDIADLELTKDKAYAITMNSNDWYKHNKTAGTAATYPVTAGNIKITSYKWVSGTGQTYPTNSEVTYYAGDLSFDFQQIE